MAEQHARLFAAFLERSLRLLLTDSPQHLAMMRSLLRGKATSICIGDGPAVRVQLDVEPWVGPAAACEITAAIAQADLLALMQGSLSIEEAVDDDRLLLRGELDHLLGFLDALNAWIHGAVRCPAFPGLYRDYLAQTRSN